MLLVLYYYGRYYYYCILCLLSVLNCGLICKACVCVCTCMPMHSHRPRVSLRNEPFAYIGSSAPQASSSLSLTKAFSLSSTLPSFLPSFLPPLSSYPCLLYHLLVRHVNPNSPLWQTRRLTWRTSTKGDYYPIAAIQPTSKQALTIP